MPEALGQNINLPQRTDFSYMLSTDEEPIIYPEQREDDIGETSIHISLVTNLLSVLKLFLKERSDVFISANMNLYYEEGNPNKWYAPDILIAFGVPNHNRSSYQIWNENVSPQVIFEVASERTWKIDISEKLDIYGQLGVEEYYILDAEFAYLPAPLLAFHREDSRLLTTDLNDNRVLSPRLALEIVRTENCFRLFDPRINAFLLTLEESEERRHRTETELELLKAEIEKLKADR